MPTKSPRAETVAGAQRALVVGVSEYPDPESRLPAVAADLREMAKVLSSRNGAFPAESVTVMADKRATRSKVLAALTAAFGGAAGETVFVYLAGHGTKRGEHHYYCAYDGDVPLADIKALFDGCKSRRVFLWLDFCHSGGIVARGRAPTVRTMTAASVKRALGVVSGQGKVIVAACTSAQFSYEHPALGHGFFTHALLRGLKGEAKSAQGEVTANSLYDFIDHQVANADQQPVFSGDITGRIVLAHYPDRGAASAKKPVAKAAAKPKKAKPKAASRRVGTWVMLGDDFFLADVVSHGVAKKLEIKATTTDGANAAVFARLRAGHSRGMPLPFAADNDAHLVRVGDITSEATGGRQVWTIPLAAEDSGFGAAFEATYSGNGKSITPDDAAKQRAGRILLNDPPPRDPARRGYDADSFASSWIEGNSRYPVRQCVVRDIYAAHRSDPNWKQYARLKALFQIRAAGVVEHVHALTLGAVRAGGVAVRFRGERRPQSTNAQPALIEVTGVCLLGLASTKEAK